MIGFVISVDVKNLHDASLGVAELYFEGSDLCSVERNDKY